MALAKAPPALPDLQDMVQVILNIAKDKYQLTCSIWELESCYVLHIGTSLRTYCDIPRISYFGGDGFFCFCIEFCFSYGFGCR
jgi:hypothetical protein